MQRRQGNPTVNATSNHIIDIRICGGISNPETGTAEQNNAERKQNRASNAERKKQCA